MRARLLVWMSHAQGDDVVVNRAVRDGIGCDIGSLGVDFVTTVW